MDRSWIGNNMRAIVVTEEKEKITGGGRGRFIAYLS
jgi:hypothetical protein